MRTAAAAAFKNAASVLEDVDLLYQSGRWPRTVSLAIVGQEELGKAVIYAVAALDRLPGLREVLLASSYEAPVRNHQFKQLAADIASIAHFMAEDLIYDSDGMAGPTHDREWVDTVLADAADWLHRSGVTKGQKARRAYVREQERRLQALTADLPEPLQGAASAETRKWRGLYVDLAEGVLHEPRIVSEFDARSARTALDIDISALFRLQTFLEDNERWSELDRTPVNIDEGAGAATDTDGGAV